MHIIEAYASNCCLKIDKPFIYEKYYPLPANKYITLHHPNKTDSRKYDHWDSVVRLLKPVLDKEGIEIVQVGSGSEVIVKHCHNLLGRTSLNQLAYVIGHSMLHLGVDSLPIHLASGYGKKIVGLYSNKYACHSGPYWSKDEDVILLESDKGGDKPTYAANEEPKTINTITPEGITKSVCSLLGLDFNYEYETLYTGKYFHIGLVETVPEEVVKISNMEGQTSYIRADIKNTNTPSKNIDAQLSIDGRYTLMLDKPIDIKILIKNKKRIDTIVYIIDDSSRPSFYDEVISAGLKCTLATFANDEEYEKIKFRFLDYPIVTRVKIDRLDEVKQLEGESIKKLFYQTNKYTIHKAKYFPSQAALENGEPAPRMDPSDVYQIPDNPIFFKDLDHIRILKKTS